MKYSGEELRQGWLRSIEAYHKSVIRDTQSGHPGDIQAITDMINLAGWNWYLKQHGTPVKVGDQTIYLYQEQYRSGGKNQYMEWCGLGLAAAGTRVGDYLEQDHSVNVMLKPSIAYYVMPSTVRLASHLTTADKSKWKQAGVQPPQPVAPADVAPGDVVTVGSTWCGSHIAMVRAIKDKKTFTTFECNAYGTLGDGKYGEGVITRERKFTEIKQVYRFDTQHFVEGK